ncbi:Chloroperoxidase [Mycena latifolia]|nr:Chloroperoxidase [Mycena latifolia]
MPLLRSVRTLLRDIYIFTWDAVLTLANLFAPNLKPGRVITGGHPGADGKWPEYIPPGVGDSRSACPALNALANHDGRNIKFTEMTRTVRQSFNFAQTFSHFVSSYGADTLLKDYGRDTFDLAELNMHNGIEHDASLTRQDAKFEPDQSKPHLPFIHEFLGSATGTDQRGNRLLTPADISRYSGKRRAEGRAKNLEFTLDKAHKMFGSSNACTLLKIFGGRIPDLEPFLIEERIPQGWEPQVRSRLGITFLTFNRTVLKVENAIKEEPVAAAPAEGETAS